MDMEHTVEELNKIIQFKDTTEPGDVVLFVNEGSEDSVPFSISYAVVNGFTLDTTKRDEWWHVHFTFLTIPPQPQTVILQPAHFTGREIFTMGGKKVFIKSLDFESIQPAGGDDEDTEKPPKKKEKTRNGLRVVK